MKKNLSDLKKQLTPLQFHVSQEGGTEPPFENKFWNFYEDGIYVDVASNEPLFCSEDKFDSGTGWPSFSKPILPSAVEKIPDHTLGQVRTEVLSQLGKSHLGHVFDDGPPPTNERYCMNSSSLRFVPLDLMKDEGFGPFLFLFKKKKDWEEAILAGGCFWGAEELLRALPGVITTQVGYSGGTLDNPTYSDICTGTTRHAEAVRILFDPKVVSYQDLLLFFFKFHDPTTLNRQENDRGTQYRSAIFYLNLAQKKIAQETMRRVDESKAWKKPIVTSLEEAQTFWPAEEEHQNYLVKNPGGYQCHHVRPLKF